VQQLVHQQQQQLVQHKCCENAAADVMQLVQEQYEICVTAMQKNIYMLHMHIIYAYQKCKCYVHQVSTTYVNVKMPKYVQKETATQQGSAYTKYTA
jgi:hypothetical protein